MPRIAGTRSSAGRAALALLCVAGCASSSDPRLVTAPAGAVDLRAERVKDFLVITCEVDGRGPFDLLLDTGAEWVVLDDDAAGLVGIEVDELTTADVSTSGIRVDHVPAQRRDLSLVDAALGRNIDGILGYPFFQELLLTIDYPGGRVSVSTDRLDPGAPGVTACDAYEVRPYVEVFLQGTGRRALVDTGSGTTLAIGADDVAWKEPPREIGRAATAFGTRVRRAGIAEGELRVGALTLRDPQVEVGVDDPRIGAAALRAAVISFDQRSMLVRVLEGGAR